MVQQDTVMLKISYKKNLYVIPQRRLGMEEREMRDGITVLKMKGKQQCHSSCLYFIKTKVPSFSTDKILLAQQVLDLL